MNFLGASGLAAVLILSVGTRAGLDAASGEDAPSIAALDPNTATAGSPGFILTVSGARFERNAVVRWNGEERASIVVNGTAVRARIPASDVAAAGTADVTVVNAAFSRVSNVLTFRIAPASQFGP